MRPGAGSAELVLLDGTLLVEHSPGTPFISSCLSEALLESKRLRKSR